ncbi:unnamed protein product, partial [Polarella glacialis]
MAPHERPPALHVQPLKVSTHAGGKSAGPSGFPLHGSFSSHAGFCSKPKVVTEPASAVMASHERPPALHVQPLKVATHAGGKSAGPSGFPLHGSFSSHAGFCSKPK